MKTFARIPLIAMGLALAGQATAQSGASAGGGSSPAAPRQGSAQTPRPANPFSTMNYLNHGDYVGGVAAHGVVQAVRNNRGTAYESDALSQFVFNAVPGAFVMSDNGVDLRADGLEDLALSMGTPSNREGLPITNGDTPVQPTMSSFETATFRPTSAGGTRPVSGVEDAQTAAFGSIAVALDQRIVTASAILAAANRTNDAGLIGQAQSLLMIAQQQRTDIQSAIEVSQAYRGHAFASEQEAQSYVNLRQEALAFIVPSANSTQYNNFVDRATDLYNRISPSVTGMGGQLQDIRTAVAEALRTSRVIETRASETVASVESENVYSQAGRSALRNRFGDTVDLVPNSPAGMVAYVRTPRSVDDDADSLRNPHAPGAASANAGAAGHSAAGGHDAMEDAAAAATHAAHAANDAVDQPEPVPTAPNYPTHDRTDAERDAADARRATAAAQAQAAALEAQIHAQQAQQAALEAQARREAARLADERARLAAAAQARNAQDANWRAMVDASFRTFQSPGWGAFDDLDPLQRGALYDAVWEAFERNGGSLTTLELEAIYEHYDPHNAIPPAQSLSSAGNSLSAAGRSLSAAGTPVRSGTDDYDDPAVQSLYEVLYGLTGRRRGPLGPSEDEVQTANAGDYDLYSDPTGRWGRESGGYLAANLFDNELDYLRRSIVNGRGGLSALLAQPFNVILTWGPGAYDLDLHMTGPTGLGESDRFHIYYSATGSLSSFPFAALIKDCICNSGSEVILTTTLLGGGVYRVSVFNFGDQASNSNNLSNASNAVIQIVRGGTAVSQGNGTTIQGGRVILTANVPNGQFGNTWVAVELDPRSGRITVPRSIVQSQDSAHVR